MLSETLSTLFKRDLNKLKSEIELYQSEKNLWLVNHEIPNCAGNLCLHLVGNLQAYIGAELGNSGYIRQRDLEFSRKDVPRAELIREIETTIEVVDRTLAALPEERLGEEYPLLVFKEKTSTEYFLVHLAVHLGYHLGQLNYHRRLLDKQRYPG